MLAKAPRVQLGETTDAGNRFRQALYVNVNHLGARMAIHGLRSLDTADNWPSSGTSIMRTEKRWNNGRMRTEGRVRAFEICTSLGLP
jgi:hypothetical protein